MGKNINQIATAATSILATDKLYLGRSPFGITDDRYILGSSIISQLAPLTTKGDLYSFSTVNARLAVAVGDGKILQVSSGAATGLAYSTPTYPSGSGSAGLILRSDGTNNVYSQTTYPDTVSVSTILYGSSANVIGGIASAQNGVLVSGNTNIPVMLAGPAATGRVLTSNAAAAPAWSTATFPVTGGTAGNILISDGTNYIASTSLWPNTVGNSGKLIQSNGTSNVYSTPTWPTTAGTSGSIVISDGTNKITSTSLWPNTVGTVGKIVRSDGTTNAYTTSTFADTYTASNLLYSNGANTVTGLATANNGVLVTDGSGVPSILAGPGSAGLTILSSAAAAPVWSTSPPITQVNVQRVTASGAGTYTPTSGMKYVIVRAQAAGGGSGGVAACGATEGGASGGGGGGEYIEALFTAAQIGASKAFSVGAGGTAGSAGNNAGGAGGNTTFNTTWIVTNGGSGSNGAANLSLAAPVYQSLGGPGNSGGSVATGTLLRQIPGGGGAYSFLLTNTGAGGLGGAAGCGTGATLWASAGAGFIGFFGAGATGAGIANAAAVAGAVGGNGFIEFIEFISV